MPKIIPIIFYTFSCASNLRSFQAMYLKFAENDIYRYKLFMQHSRMIEEGQWVYQKHINGDFLSSENGFSSQYFIVVL